MDPTEAPAPAPPPDAPPKRKAGPGRPTKCTAERIAKIAKLVAEGHFLSVAARVSGIGETTLHRWMERGAAAKKGPYRRFWRAMQHAEALNEVRLVRLWTRAGKKDWRAAMEMAARRYPERWSPPKDRVELDANVNHAGAVRVWLPPEDS